MKNLNTLKSAVLAMLCIGVWQNSNAQPIYSSGTTIGSAAGGTGVGIGAVFASQSLSYLLEVNGDINIDIQDQYDDYSYRISGEPVLRLKGWNSTAFTTPSLVVGMGAGTDLDFAYVATGNGSNTILGNYAGQKLNDGVAANQYAHRNTLVGYGAGQYINESNESVMIGYFAGRANSAGTYDPDYNVAIGAFAAEDLTSGFSNCVIGTYAGRDITSAGNNVMLGYNSGKTITTASQNTFIGSASGINNTSGTSSVFIGYNTGASNTTGSYNTFVGNGAGPTGTSYQGSNNTLLGENASYSTSSLSYATAIGSDAVVEASNRVVLGRPLTGGGAIQDIVYIADDGTTTASSGVALYVNGKIEAISTVYPSDERYKKDINSITNAIDKVSSLNAKTYRYRTEDFPNKAFNDGLQYGFIAQELKEVLPDVVFQKKDGFYAVDYTMIIPVLAQAIKEQQGQIEELKAGNTTFGENKTNAALEGALVSIDALKEWQLKVDAKLAEQEKVIAELKAENAALKAETEAIKVDFDVKLAQQNAAMEARLTQFEQSLAVCCNSNSGSTIDKARLEQNNPNPFSTNTIIKYYVPISAANAYLSVSTAEGAQLMKVDITEKGAGSVVISANTLASGTYFYSLTVDGELVGAKKMIVVK